MVASLLLLAVLQGDEMFGARERAWQASLSGDVRADNVFVSGSEVDFEDDFDLDSEVFHDVTIWMNFPLLPLRANAGVWFGGFEEDVTLSRTIVFGDEVFLASTTVNAVVDFRCYYLNGEFFLPAQNFGVMSISAGVTAGLKYIWAEAEITNESAGIEEAQDVEGAFPVIGIDVIANIAGLVRVQLEVNGLAGDYGLLSGRFVDASLEASVAPIKNVFIGVGYKMVQMKLATTGDPETEVDLTMQGPFVSIGLRF